MIHNNRLVLNYKELSKKGTRFIPIADSSLAVDSIASYYSAQQYSHSYGGLTGENKLSKSQNNSEDNTLISPSLSPIHKRKLFHTNIAQQREQRLSLYYDAFNSIEDILLPKYETKLNTDKYLAKFIDSKLLATKDSANIRKQILEEAEHCFKLSVKESIIDYCLMNEEIAEKLGIENSRYNKNGIRTILSRTPWRNSFIEAKQFNEKHNFVFNGVIVEMIGIWSKHFFAIDIFEWDTNGPIDAEQFKSTVRANCDKLNASLRFDWVSRCSEVVLNRCPHLVGLDSVRDERLFNAIATLMSRLTRELIVDSLKRWVNILEVRSAKSLPLFEVKLEWKSFGVPCFAPPVQTWNELLAFAVYELLRANEQIPRIENQLILRKPKDYRLKNLENVRVDDYEVQSCLRKIQQITDQQISDNHIIDYYERHFDSVGYDSTKDKLTEKYYEINDLRSLIRKSESALDKLILESGEKRCGIFLVNCESLNSDIYAAIRHSLNEQIETKVRGILTLATNIRDCCLTIELNSEKEWSTTSALVDQISEFDEYRSNVNLMLFDIEYVENHWTFLVEEGSPFVNDADFELLHQLYNWPQRIMRSNERHERRLNQSKTDADNRLKARIAQFESKLADLEDVISHFKRKKLSSPLESVKDNVSSLNEIERELSNAVTELDAINGEQRLLEWPSLSRFELLNELIKRKAPLDSIWKTADTFETHESEWMAKSMRSLNVNEVRETVDQLLDRATEMSHSFQTESPDLLQNASSLRARIVSFRQKYVPLLQVLRNPVLRDRHWLKISAILGQEITADSCRTLSDVAQLTSAANYIAEIESLGSIAVKEHALEVFLEKMKNEWIEEWPTDALDIAANKFLEGENLEVELKEKCANAFKCIHEDARQFSLLFGDQTPGIPIRVSPPLFVELILTFKDLLKRKQLVLCAQRDRYRLGVEKLESAANHVELMRNQLVNNYKPQLVVASEETETLMIRIERETLQIETKKEIIAADEAIANKSASLSQQIKDECTKELAQAIPAIKSAVTALNTLKAEDITFLRTMKKPPTGVRMVLEAVCIIKGVQPERRLDPRGVTKLVDDYWSAALKMMSSDINFLESLKRFDRDHIPRDAIAIVRQKYIQSACFETDALRSVSLACEGLAKWVKAIDIYDRVVNVVKPKREKWESAERELESVMQLLENKKAELQRTTDRLQQLNDEFAAMSKKKRELEENIEFCSVKLERAQQLIMGLEGEKNRWRRAAEMISVENDNIVGDVLLAAAIVVYGSALNSNNRNACTEKWQKYLKAECRLSFTEPFNLVKALATPADTQKWAHAAIINDEFSTENAIIVENSRRCPIVIDPNRLAFKWLKKLYPNSVEINFEQSSEECIQHLLRKAVKNGDTVLLGIEKLHNQELCTIFDPILKKEIVVLDGKQFMKWENKTIDYSEDFKLFICATQLLHLTPITSSRVSLINWCLSTESQTAKTNASTEVALLLQARAEKERQLIDLEDQILQVLSTAKTNVLEDENAIQILVTYKNLAQQLATDDIK